MIDSIDAAIARWHLRRSRDTYIGQCPFCQKQGYKHSHPFVLFPKGNYFCHACNIKGHINGNAPIYRPTLRPIKPRPRAALPDPLQWANHPKAVAYFGSRGLTLETVACFCLGYDGWRFTIPCWQLADGKLMGIKRRKDPGNPADHAPKYTSYKGSRAWIFNEMAMESDECVLVEGEVDCMTLAQAGVAAVCSTAGVGHFPDEWVERLAGKRVTIWFDWNDVKTKDRGVFKGWPIGRAEAIMLAQRLEAAGIEVRIVKDYEGKDVNEYINALCS